MDIEERAQQQSQPFKISQSDSTKNTSNKPKNIMDVGNLFFTGDLVHIVGTNIDDRGRSCTAHSPRPCGSALRVDDWITFCLIEFYNEGLNEDAIEVRRIVQGQETCRVGFLQRSYVPHF